MTAPEKYQRGKSSEEGEGGGNKGRKKSWPDGGEMGGERKSKPGA